MIEYKGGLDITKKSTLWAFIWYYFLQNWKADSGEIFSWSFASREGLKDCVIAGIGRWPMSHSFDSLVTTAPKPAEHCERERKDWLLLREVWICCWGLQPKQPRVEATILRTILLRCDDLLINFCASVCCTFPDCLKQLGPKFLM